MRIRLLGGVDAVHDDDTPVDVGPAKSQALLAALALSVGESVPISRLVELVWGDEPPRTADRTLQSYVTRLRRALGQGSIVRTGHAYRLTLECDAVDTCRFQRHLAAGEIKAALAEWTGTPLAGLEVVGLLPVVKGLVEQWLGATEANLECQVELDPTTATAQLMELTAEYPFREGLWGLLMLALYKAGRQADALAAYTEARNQLVEHLGVEPGPRLQELEALILDQDPTLDAASSRSAPLDAGSRPSGTVTFLFTDIEGSTQLWNDHPIEMAEAHAMHDRVMRTAIESAAGHVFSTAGDSFAAAFARPHNALEAAVAAQRELVDVTWPLPVSIGVRMGLHVGVADERQGDYFGASPSRAARIMAVAEAGQVVVSAAARHVLGDDLGHDIRLIDEGEHWLRDFDTTERLYRVHHPDLSAKRLGPATRVVPASNLPVQRNSFVGRDRETAGVRAALTESRLVTLTGVGGVGKTRLALQAAAESLVDYRHGVWVVELASVTAAERIGERVATALGLDELNAEAVSRYLGDRSVLLVLDNCEHLIAPVAELVEELLDRCPSVQVLATSREGLAVVGERIVAVPPLAVTAPDGTAPAAQLFLDRAAGTSRVPETHLADADAVDAICRRLDGVPLAIELAAARTSVMTAAEIAAHLDDVFRLLTGGPRTVVERHQTLRAAVDWSFELLDARERALFCRLGVFVDGFTLPAAVFVGGAGEIDDYEAINALDRLVQKSLVASETRRGTTRFHLLETLRRYALDRLADRGEAESGRLRHTEWAAGEIEAFARLWDSPDQLLAMDRLTEERQNLEAAARWCVEQGEVEPAGRMAVGLAPTFLAGFDAPALLQVLFDVPGLDRHPGWPGVIGTTSYMRRSYLSEAADAWQSIVDRGETPPGALNLAFARAIRKDPGRWRAQVLPVLQERWAANDGEFDIDLLSLTATGYQPGLLALAQPIWRAVIDGQIQAAGRTGRPFDVGVVHWIKGHLDLSENRTDLARHHFELAATAYSETRSPAMAAQTLSELALLTHNHADAQSLLDRLVEQTPLDDLGRADRNTRLYVYEALVVILALLDQAEAAALVLGACDASHGQDGLYSDRRTVAERVEDLAQRLGPRFDTLRQEGAAGTNDEIYERIRPVIHELRRQQPQRPGDVADAETTVPPQPAQSHGAC